MAGVSSAKSCLELSVHTSHLHTVAQLGPRNEQKENKHFFLNN